MKRRHLVFICDVEGWRRLIHNQNKFITSFVHVRMGLSSHQSYTSQKEESKKNINCLIRAVQSDVWP